ncbi:FAD-dependent oxidoreductase [Actinocorallia sp. A-T 12471]|uniref:NAD(P)/FAD-dependent oxidoreductase n=1 Tax=Actinocorallia sp. A-T 12471 TaxID=3089813 RepID=UPI0029CD6A4D|nr:FAD-dependent oxidoreductase [Actinocorallia sp. A-T 12471]MDX6739819.1 FAD-dependent oxidoreductase [Actinocorallia sp. A-T 12471]
MAPRYDLIVVGGGVIGTAVAESLRHHLGKICLIERSELRQGSATVAAAGGINPHLGDGDDEGVSLLAQRSRDLYPAWVERIAEEAGLPLRPRATGLLQVAVDAREHRRLTEETLPRLRARGIRAHVLDAAQAREREPLLGPEVLGALEQPDDLAIDPRRLAAVLDSVIAADPRVDREFAEVVLVASGPGHAEVVLGGGDRLLADTVVVAAGHQSGTLLPMLPPDVFEPVKGQLLDVRERPGLRLGVQCDALLTIDGREHVVYASPYAEGHIAVGVTFEKHETDTKCMPWARDEILANLRRVLPTLAAEGARGATQRAGIRPATRDKAPLIGRVADRLVVASGHSGLGITLAPRTAELVGRVVTGSALSAGDARDLAFADPRRFLTAR